MSAPRFCHNLRRAVVGAGVTALVVTLTTFGGSPAVSAATITAAYDAGHGDVIINGYGTDGMGTFALTDGEHVLRALCVEADVAHSDRHEAYARVDSTTASAELDALLWWLERQGSIDDDTAVAASALAWYYAGATRGAGPLVWSDGSQGFAPISPSAPQPWESLAPFSLSYPVGLTSRGEHLDIAEDRVAELHRLVTSLAPPWSLTAIDGETFEVSNSAGPIAGIDVEISFQPAGPTESSTVVVRTASDGTATRELPAAPDGAIVTATVAAPGPHQEWDGDRIQRLATATTATVTETTVVPPLPRFIEARKTSSDPTIGVGGAVFDLTDAHGRLIGSATTGIDGRAPFEPIDPVMHPGPYTLVETVAPAGLVRDGQPVSIGEASIDAEQPTVVTVSNQAATVAMSVRKTLSMPTVGPGDLTGFGFVATRRSDGDVHHLGPTGPDGSTPPIDVPLGTYDVCESGAPEWADGLTDGGCVEVAVGLAELTGPPIDVTYLNVVPTPTIDTWAIDPADGDRTLDLGATLGAASVIDLVELDGLVPGTRYTLTGELIGLDRERSHDDPDVGSDFDVIDGSRSTITFVADASTSLIELQFDLGLIDDLTPGRYVIVDHLSIGETTVADHRDLSDPDQTITIVAAPTPTTVGSTTTMPPTVPPSTTTPTTTPTTPSTLPPTGASGALISRVLGVGDVGFIIGVALVALGASRPRRRDANGAGC